MGLDMYLIRKKYVGAKYEHRKVEGEVNINVNGKQLPIDFNKISNIEEEVGYWRKANQIHNWFVNKCQDGVDDCKEYYVTFERLKELLRLCKEVKNKAILKNATIENGKKLEDGKWVPILEKGKIIENAEEIEELLPTQEGFFFGGTNYDEYYIQDIENTIQILEQIINEEETLNKSGIYCDYYYQSSW